eukprot:Protomagalhaensia_sp_Gyna_25__2676@NODE_252_length_4177_cov_67_681730_g194_i0_p2_GENE_NODE_252_length_4177_cov_67_681730_g194_i0NODE_252_length_4177_cov_67_681730_g194_i0_p2_ORF_typecomplete_len294_score47_09UPF0016/PF01169_19/5_8e17UPF0016/PF01169_19/3_1e28Mntp/PF02659_15/6_4e06TauE/PF01925_19/88TauE/PF01925_19/0_0068NUDIX_4/PF14815_6/0_064_NODE_252_length_4177_cov_67_681730_g194_i031183999
MKGGLLMLALSVCSAVGQGIVGAGPPQVPITTTPNPEVSTTNQFISALITSYALIIVTELGDKTFFIAALLAMKRGCCVTFTGAASALVVMTLIAAFLGMALPALMSPKLTQLASIVIFAFFGIKLLWEGYRMESGEESDELIEVEKALAGGKKEDAVVSGDGDLESSPSRANAKEDAGHVFSHLRWWLVTPMSLLSSAFIEAFSLTFAAEWGDRSQIATLALGASKNIYGVNLGAILGHMCCTGLAVLGGKMLASRISEKLVTLIGGTTFLFFALAGYLWEVRDILQSTFSG